MLHGWMDVAASFQFVVDALADDRHVLALDWRGFGASDTPAADTYFFPEYLGDLELVLDALFGRERAPIDLLGHSMGGNVAMLYAGVRPAAGPPARQPRRLRHAALEARAARPGRMAKWLDELKTPMQLRPYADLGAVAERADRRPTRCCAPTAPPGSPRTGRRPTGDGDERALLADPNHKRMSPLLAQVDELARVLEADHRAAALGRGRPHRRQRLVGRPLHQGRVPRAAERRRRRRAPRRRAGRPHAAPRPARGHRPAARGVPVRIAPSPKRPELEPTMDVEHINAIGNRLADLTKRTVDLRGYL